MQTQLPARFHPFDGDTKSKGAPGIRIPRAGRRTDELSPVREPTSARRDVL